MADDLWEDIMDLRRSRNTSSRITAELLDSPEISDDRDKISDLGKIDPNKSSDAADESFDSLDKSGNPDKNRGDPDKYRDDPDKYRDDPEKSSDVPEKSSDDLDKSSDDLDKSSDDLDKSSDDPDISSDDSDESWDEEELKDFITMWTRETKMFVSDQILNLSLRIRKKMKIIEGEMHAYSLKKYQYKIPLNKKTENKEAINLQTFSPGYANWEERRDSKINLSQSDRSTLTGLVEYLSEGSLLNINSDDLVCQLTVFCEEITKRTQMLNKICQNLRNSVNEISSSSKLLAEFYNRDLSMITERIPGTTKEYLNQNEQLQSLNRSMKHTFIQLETKLQSVYADAEKYCELIMSISKI